MDKFQLKYKILTIGHFTYDGKWQFQYSSDFKAQSKIQPLFDFPDLDHIYRSRYPFLFLQLRVPPLDRPDIRAKLKNHPHPISFTDLLILFGKQVIHDPFSLEFQK